MALRTFPGSLPPESNQTNQNLNLGPDGSLTTGSAFTSVWTGGQSSVQQLQGVTPSRTEEWSLIGVTITALLLFFLGLYPGGGAPGTSIYGKFGKVIALIWADTANPSPGYSYQAAELPAFPLGQIDLWDPATDMMPPTFRSPGPFAISPSPGGALQVTKTLLLPAPFTIVEQTQLFFGVWMLTSLLGWRVQNVNAAFGLCLYNCRYSMLMDDGS